MTLDETLSSILAEGYSPTLQWDSWHQRWSAYVRKPLGQFTYSFGRGFAEDPIDALELAFANRDNVEKICDGSVAYADKLKAADLRPRLALRRL